MSISKKIKTRWNNPETGSFEIKEFTAHEIVKDPIRKEPEAIISALCACVDWLVSCELERQERVKALLSKTQG